MSDWRLNFGQNLHHLRQVYGMSQTEMAKIVGVCVGTYRKMERCDPAVRIQISRVQRICAHFNIAAEDFLNQNWKKIREGK